MEQNARIWLYSFFYTALYCPQNREAYQPFFNQNVLAALVDSDEDQDIARLAAWLDAAPEASHDVWDAQEEDRRALFANSGVVKAAPWGSVWQNPEHVLNDEHTLQLRQMYRRFNLTVEDPGKGPEDHIGLEMLCMARLAECENNPTQAEAARSAQREMLTNHLSAFFGDFQKAVATNAMTSFYRDLVAVALDFVRFEAAEV